MGCCCGHPDRGGPKTVPGTLKRQMRRAFREARLEGLRLAFTDCLGPCSEANVVFLYVHGRPFWLRRINQVETFGQVLAWAAEAAARARRPRVRVDGRGPGTGAAGRPVIGRRGLLAALAVALAGCAEF